MQCIASSQIACPWLLLSRDSCLLCEKISNILKTSDQKRRQVASFSSHYQPFSIPSEFKQWCKPREFGFCFEGRWLRCNSIYSFILAWNWSNFKLPNALSQRAVSNFTKGSVRLSRCSPDELENFDYSSSSQTTTLCLLPTTNKADASQVDRFGRPKSCRLPRKPSLQNFALPLHCLSTPFAVWSSSNPKLPHRPFRHIRQWPEIAGWR